MDWLSDRLSQIPSWTLNIERSKLLTLAYICFDSSLNLVGVQFKVPVMWVLLTLDSNAVVTLSALTNNQVYQIPSATFYLWYPGCLVIENSTMKSKTIVLKMLLMLMPRGTGAGLTYTCCSSNAYLQKPSQLMVRSQPYARYGSKLDIMSNDFGNNMLHQYGRMERKHCLKSRQRPLSGNWNIQTSWPRKGIIEAQQGDACMKSISKWNANHPFSCSLLPIQMKLSNDMVS